MKKFITPDYIFTPGSPGSGNVELSIKDFDPKKLVAIINTTKGELIYIPTSPSKNATGITGNNVRLKVDTTLHDEDDILQILYEDDTELEIQNALLYLINSLVEKLPRVDTLDRQVVNVEQGTVAVSSLPTLSLITSLTNLNNFSGGNTAGIPQQTSQMGALHIYNQIIIS